VKQENSKLGEKFSVIFGDRMSRIGKIPVAVPKEVKINIDSQFLRMEGPKGKLLLKIPEGIKVEVKDQELQVNRLQDTRQSRADHGTTRSHLVNMVKGVTVGHKKDLEIQGIGFRAQALGDKITFNLGFSHPVELPIPKDVKATVANQTNISLEGADTTVVGQFAAEIRALKPVEPYKGKGIRYVGEIVKRKQGKSVTKGA